jgi:hypothetical protein
MTWIIDSRSYPTENSVPRVLFVESPWFLGRREPHLIFQSNLEKHITRAVSVDKLPEGQGSLSQECIPVKDGKDVLTDSERVLCLLIISIFDNGCSRNSIRGWN